MTLYSTIIHNERTKMANVGSKKCEKYSFANKAKPKTVTISARNYNRRQNLPGYFFRTLQDFATKLSNVTNFVMFF